MADSTRERVLAVAAELGYEPDPDLARLMHRVRSRKTVKIRDEIPQDNLLGPSYQYVPIKVIRQRAHGHGYAVEEFWLGRED